VVRKALVSGYRGRLAVSVISESRSMGEETMFSGRKSRKTVMISDLCVKGNILKTVHGPCEANANGICKKALQEDFCAQGLVDADAPASKFWDLE